MSISGKVAPQLPLADGRRGADGTTATRHSTPAPEGTDAEPRTPHVPPSASVGRGPSSQRFTRRSATDPAAHAKRQAWGREWGARIRAETLRLRREGAL